LRRAFSGFRSAAALDKGVAAAERYGSDAPESGRFGEAVCRL